MATKVATNLSLDPDLKKDAAELFSDLGMDLSTAVSVFLRQAVRVQGFPFVITRETPNADTIAAMNEYYEMKEHPENYKVYDSFKDLMNEVLADDA
jgi:DNA-damage-inducible protein J